MKDNNVWCVLPWTHLCIRTDNTLKPCCRFQSNNPSNEFKETLDDIAVNGTNAMNSDFFKNIRQKMINGEPLDGCIKCYSEEKRPNSQRLSMRQTYNEELSHLVSQTKLDFEKVRYIEMSIDNICNLQCKMCDSKFSSKLQNRDKFLGNIVHKKLEPNFEKLNSLDLSNLERVKILGGEPFITPNFEKFLDFLYRKSNPSIITLDIVTNATTMPSKSVIKKLENFKSIWIKVSLDAYDKANDYQRFGSNYLKTFENATFYKDYLKNSFVSFHVTTSVLTANTLHKTIDYLRSKNFSCSVDFVRDPPHMSLLNAPDLFVEWILEKNKSNKDAFALLNNFLKEYRYNKVEWANFLNITKKLDNYYNVSLKNYNEDLFNFLDKNYHYGDRNVY